MKIGVIGLGNVGMAVAQSLKDKHEVLGYDNQKPCAPFESLLDREVLFICTPTPTNQMRQNSDSIKDVIKLFSSKGFSGLYVVKSTILPGTIAKISKIYPNARIVHNPEFLSQASAKEDFAKQKKVIIGGESFPDMEIVGQIYASLGATDAWYVSTIQAEFIKYLHNCYLASKIAILNEMYDIAESIGVDYQSSINIAAEVTGWINKRHIKVPGPDGWFGFGGACYPKDMEALVGSYMHLNLEAISSCLASNKKRRRHGKAPEKEAVVERVKLHLNPRTNYTGNKK